VESGLDTLTFWADEEPLENIPITGFILQGAAPPVKIVSFSSGTDAQIKAMLDAYYNDEITW